jgi:hypothetical protein
MYLLKTLSIETPADLFSSEVINSLGLCLDLLMTLDTPLD